MADGLTPHHNTFIVAAIVIIVLVLGGIFIAIYSLRQGEGLEPSQAAPESLQEEPEPAATIPPVPTVPQAPKAVSSPVEELTKTNPFEAETNPFYSAYKNPFE